MKKKNFLISLFIFIICLGGFGYINTHKKNDINANTNKTLKNSTSYKKKIKSNKEDVKDVKKNIEEKETLSSKYEGKELIYNTESIPVLMYHSITTKEKNAVCLLKDDFEKQMEYLKNNDYTVLTLNELYDFFEKNIPIPKKSIVLTLDDGYADNYTNAFPILKKYNFKATIFLISDTIDDGSYYLNSSQIKEMSAYGIDFQSHTTKHDDLTKLNYDDQLKTLKDSKEKLEKILNKKVEYIAYPYGRYNEDTLNILKDTEYKMGFIMGDKWSFKEDFPYKIKRVFISGSRDLDSFINRITNPNYN